MNFFSHEARETSDKVESRRTTTTTATTVYTVDCLNYMTCNYSKSARVLNEDKHLCTPMTEDTGDCIDFLTRVCILVPYETILHEDIEFTESFASNTEQKNLSQDDYVETTHMLSNSTQLVDSNHGFDLGPIVEDPPIHFAETDRHHGCCPLGHQETIYFNENTPIM